MSSELSDNAPKISVFLKRTDTRLFLVTLILRLIALPFATGLDSDDVTRILFSYEWLQDPYFIMCEVWPSLHYYLIALFIWVFDDHVFAPMLINILLGAFTTPVIYNLTKTLYDQKGALMASIIYLLCPLFFRLNLEVMSETPFLLLMGLSMLFLIKGLKGEMNFVRAGILAGLSIAIASGFRMEAWLVTPLFAGVAVFQRNFKLATVFVAASITYPLFWMFTCFVETGDPIFSIHRSAEWNHYSSGINDNVDGVILAQRLLIQPLTMFLMLSPWLLGLMFAAWVKKIRQRAFPIHQWMWLLPFVILLSMYEYKIYVGDMNVHPRYSSTLMCLLIPHFAILTQVFRYNWLKWFVILAAIGNFIMSFYYPKLPIEQLFGLSNKAYHAVGIIKNYQLHKEQAIPILRNKNTPEYEAAMWPELDKGEGLILDFVGWESTYHTMLHSGQQRADILVLIGDALKNTYANHLIPPFIEDHPEGVLFLKKGSGAFQNSEFEQEGEVMLLDGAVYLEVNKVYETDVALIYSYKLSDLPPPDITEE